MNSNQVTLFQKESGGECNCRSDALLSKHVMLLSFFVDMGLQASVDTLTTQPLVNGAEIKLIG